MRHQGLGTRQVGSERARIPLETRSLRRWDGRNHRSGFLMLAIIASFGELDLGSMTAANVIIDPGGGFVSLYAHNPELSGSSGQLVAQRK